jgi:hypothetical protein
MKRKKLALARETIRKLTDNEASRVVGGSDFWSISFCDPAPPPMPGPPSGPTNASTCKPNPFSDWPCEGTTPGPV